MEIVLLIILSIMLLLEILKVIWVIIEWKREKNEKEIAIAMQEYEEDIEML